MTVYLPKNGVTYFYDFRYRGVRYLKSTGQTKKHLAKQVEDRVRERLRRAVGGLVEPRDAPGFNAWAATYYDWIASPRNPRRLKRPDHVAAVLRVVLRFWGGRPPASANVATVEGEPYHDLTLADPILDPEWILKFEDWMDQRTIGAQSRNHYRSVMSRMYRTALLPRFRKESGVATNPFAGTPRDPTDPRVVTVTVHELRRWVDHAPYHVRLAVAIGALAPKLRLSNILALSFEEHIDPQLRFLTFHDHKTDRRGRPLVTPIVQQLRTILLDRQRRDPHPRVIIYRGRPVTSIRGGVRLAAERAGLTYGRRDGVTFHTLRHVAQTEMAAMGITETKRSDVMGHADLATTQKYTHLRPVHELETLERFSRKVPLADLVTAAPSGKFREDFRDSDLGLGKESPVKPSFPHKTPNPANVD